MFEFRKENEKMNKQWKVTFMLYGSYLKKINKQTF